MQKGDNVQVLCADMAVRMRSRLVLLSLEKAICLFAKHRFLNTIRAFTLPILGFYTN